MWHSSSGLTSQKICLDRVYLVYWFFWVYSPKRWVGGLGQAGSVTQSLQATRHQSLFLSPHWISPVTLRKGASGKWEQGKLWVLSLSYTRQRLGEQLPLPKPQEDLYLNGLCIPAGTSQHSRLGQ